MAAGQFLPAQELRVSNLSPENFTSFTLSRLSTYLQALGKVGNLDEISIGDFLKVAGDVTHSELVRELQDLGLAVTESIPRHELARAIRRETRRARATFDGVSISEFQAPPLEPLLADLQVLDSDDNFRRAELIETAFDYSVQKPELFLSGHGLLCDEPPDDYSATSETGKEQPAAKTQKREAVALRHQITHARKIVEQMLGNAIVVHEVGLGKTLTAILVLCELLLRDRTLTSLILVPTNLKNQWLKEFSRCPDVQIYSERLPKELAAQQHVLMPIDTAKEPRWAKILNSRQWGLLVVDEGHILRNDETARYRFVYSIRARARLLLTATPVHNSAYDIYHQANIVRPGLFGQKAVFAEDHMRDERQVLDAESLRGALTTVVDRLRRDETGIAFPERDIAHVLIGERSKSETELYDDILLVLRGIYRRNLGAATYLRRPSGKQQGVATLVLVAILILRELASHPTAAFKTLSQSLMSRLKATRNTDDLQVLERIIKKHSKIDWKKEGAHSKTDRLLAEIPGLIRKHGRVIVYVEFRETQKIIVQRLQSKQQKVGLPKKTAVISYHGGLTAAAKDYQVDRFNHSARACFVSTDAGGQGLNLQAGHIVLNFDFPWNPMRVEQRIGRVDRLRQKAPKVLIRNFITTGTIEQYVYNTLRRKLKVCDDVLGHLIPRIFKLSAVQDKYLSDEDVLGIGQIILSSENDQDLRKKFKELDDELEERIADQQLVWQPTRRWLS
jgi:SNF2 family DNA or RNA helicase